MVFIIPSARREVELRDENVAGYLATSARLDVRTFPEHQSARTDQGSRIQRRRDEVRDRCDEPRSSDQRDPTSASDGTSRAQNTRSRRRPQIVCSLFLPPLFGRSSLIAHWPQMTPSPLIGRGGGGMPGRHGGPPPKQAEEYYPACAVLIGRLPGNSLASP